MPQEQEFLTELVQARDLMSALKAVRELERHFLYSWRPVGDNEANYGLINIGSDPGSALIERVTNAIDGVIEREALRQLGRKGRRAVPASPREAVDLWFRVPGGRVANLLDVSKRQPLADNVVVTLLDGDQKRRPCVMIRDRGVGLTPTQIPNTILSLSGTNKIDKPYLAGAYGQGGSTVLAFSPEGTLFVSRRQSDLLERGQADVVAVTFARYEELDPAKNKNGRYAYLVTQNREVPHVPVALLPKFECGTCVVHFNLSIERYAARMTQLKGSLWWLLQNSLFDIVLPIWAEEGRAGMLDGKKKDRRTIVGNYARLMDDSRDRIEHSDSVDVAVDHESGSTSVKVNYWVVRSKGDGGSAQPIEAYVDPYQPIAYTYFGQTHGTDERRFTSERLQLPYLAKFLILQVELDHLLPAARRELLSSTRDRLKRTQFFYDMRERICDALAEDTELIRLNDVRKEELLCRHSEKDRERMRQRFAELMERLRPGVDASGAGGGGGGEGGRPSNGPRNRDPLEPLPTRDEPTFLRIANAKRPIAVRLDRHGLVQLESDAPDGYLTSRIHAKLTMASQPSAALTLESKSDFRGGRSRLTVKPGEGATPQEGTITVYLFTPQDTVLSDVAPFRIEPAPEQPTAGDKQRARVKAPEPIPVYRSEWPDFGWDESSVAEAREDKDGGKIYVNADNRHLERLLRLGGYQQHGITRMRNNFVLYVAFYTWARHTETRGQDSVLQGKDFEDYQSAELDRAAQTVIHSIAAGARVADEAES